MRLKRISTKHRQNAQHSEHSPVTGRENEVLHDEVVGTQYAAMANPSIFADAVASDLHQESGAVSARGVESTSANPSPAVAGWTGNKMEMKPARAAVSATHRSGRGFFTYTMCITQLVSEYFQQSREIQRASRPRPELPKGQLRYPPAPRRLFLRVPDMLPHRLWLRGIGLLPTNISSRRR